MEWVHFSLSKFSTHLSLSKEKGGEGFGHFGKLLSFPGTLPCY